MMRMVYVGDNPVLKGKTALVQALESTVVESEAGIERVTAELTTLEPEAKVEAQFDEFTTPGLREYGINWRHFRRIDFEIPPCKPNDHHWNTEHTKDGERCQCAAISFPPVR